MTGFSSIVILTALGLERTAVLAHLDELQEQEHAAGTLYDIGTLANRPDVRVAVAEVGAGNVSAAVHVERAVRRFGPDLLLFVGVAGGIKDVEHGDVVVATKIYGYESGKADAAFRPRPAVYPLAHRLDQRVRRLIETGDWAATLPNGDGAPPPRAFLGPIASGDALVRSKESETFKRIRSSYNDALALEMEGRGLFEGAHLNDSLPAVVVRGISDLIDDKSEKGDERWQPIAARNAAAFAMRLLDALQSVRSPLEEGSTDALREVADWLHQAYYVNLFSLMRDPTARTLLSGEVMRWLEGAHAWADFDLAKGLRMLDIATTVCRSWKAPAIRLAEALDEKLIGARIAFDGRFRTRGLHRWDPDTGLTGDLARDPVIYTDAGQHRVFFPIDPRWITTTTGHSVFGAGQLEASGMGVLRTVGTQAIVSPTLIGPGTSATKLWDAIAPAAPAPRR